MLPLDVANDLKKIIGCLTTKHPIITEVKITQSTKRVNQVNLQSVIIFAPNVDKKILLGVKKYIIDYIYQSNIDMDWIIPKKVSCKYGLHVIHYIKTYSKTIGYNEDGKKIKQKIKLPLLIVTT